MNLPSWAVWLFVLLIILAVLFLLGINVRVG